MSHGRYFQSIPNRLTYSCKYQNTTNGVVVGDDVTESLKAAVNVV